MRALSFGAVADSYDRFRPDYPRAVYDTVADYAGQTPRTALEIGAGTGKATRLFADHGIEITATEPDEAMLDKLRATAAPTVTAVRSAFEDLRPERTYALVYVAAALHWTRPEGRWPRVAALLEPGGVFAALGGPFRLADAEVAAAVHAARAPYLDSDEVLPPDGTPEGAPMQWPGTELQACDLFEDVRQVHVERRLALSADEYVGYLRTVSAYLQLPEAVRTRAFGAIARVLPETVAINADITVHLARRRAAA
ncbi:class I SAM-dependent methyltransferase [Actinospica sp. MGRD01-02]|uniref:Class I SAM-dependent methyltransferase n=1 Tax=Actinospica acidithermotolerans TaxID=2828514 RepID=A0A941EEG5_9ACTN|nr:class I SAM-dependent methyltransferase [Actinospica acidithermotolerans]MBR7829996.1 class I SAM-dependent methyltransferase [Actinospica acidithermotolerans]